MIMNFIISGLGLAFLARVVYVLYSEWNYPLRDVPGPIAARFTRLWYFNSIWKGQAHLENILLHRKHAKPGEHYAPVVRLGPNLYSITSPEKSVYGISSKMPKSDWYDGWRHPSPDRWTMFPDRDMKRHAETRRKFQSMYSLSSLLHYEKFSDDVQAVFQRRLDEMANTGITVNMHHWLQCYAFDVIGCITYGSRFGFLDEGKDIANCMASLNSMALYSTLAGVYAWAHPYMYKIAEKLPGSGAAGRNYIMKFVSKRMEEREAQRKSVENGEKPLAADSEDKTRDFLDLALDAEHDPEKGMTRYNVFMMGLSNIIAGSDTTSTALSGILWHLTSYPESLAKLRKEIDQAIEDGKMSKDYISFKESQNLPYLQACIKEGLRVCGAAGLPMWRVVPKGGAEIMGRYFPEGSEIGINMWTAHYNKDVWGPDALKFRPDRWIEAEKDPEHLKLLESNYMPFGNGSRTCIGRHISYLEISKVVPMIVSNYDFELANPANELFTYNYWFVKPMPDAFKVVVRKRA
ncbi:hypothetical protein M409DRAFT_64101 [Zasmidium cellare ATCC 36951]|uniref:Cytochrome P450 n=1 Tax=Zasmidium cellare ATCC 36951 TaxID=1080233 RepID=A0A6A6CSR1_ZASCE|nr:uncharacterized protein M409DRAFT_64101 [Zasmidium cellare ATCC 36951]KAF2170317.1 hypothetical protein M409DRAFT_64101 [Zasmidium cellare ATCC 36951]